MSRPRVPRDESCYLRDGTVVRVGDVVNVLAPTADEASIDSVDDASDACWVALVTNIRHKKASKESTGDPVPMLRLRWLYRWRDMAVQPTARRIQREATCRALDRLLRLWRSVPSDNPSRWGIISSFPRMTRALNQIMGVGDRHVAGAAARHSGDLLGGGVPASSPFAAVRDALVPESDGEEAELSPVWRRRRNELAQYLERHELILSHNEDENEASVVLSKARIVLVRQREPVSVAASLLCLAMDVERRHTLERSPNRAQATSSTPREDGSPLLPPVQDIAPHVYIMRYSFRSKGVWTVVPWTEKTHAVPVSSNTTFAPEAPMYVLSDLFCPRLAQSGGSIEVCKKLLDVELQQWERGGVPEASPTASTSSSSNGHRPASTEAASQTASALPSRKRPPSRWRSVPAPASGDGPHMRKRRATAPSRTTIAAQQLAGVTGTLAKLNRRATEAGLTFGVDYTIEPISAWGRTLHGMIVTLSNAAPSLPGTEGGDQQWVQEQERKKAEKRQRNLQQQEQQQQQQQEVARRQREKEEEEARKRKEKEEEEEARKRKEKEEEEEARKRKEEEEEEEEERPRHEQRGIDALVRASVIAAATTPIRQIIPPQTASQQDSAGPPTGSTSLWRYQAASASHNGRSAARDLKHRLPGADMGDDDAESVGTRSGEDSSGDSGLSPTPTTAVATPERIARPVSAPAPAREGVGAVGSIGAPGPSGAALRPEGALRVPGQASGSSRALPTAHGTGAAAASDGAVGNGAPLSVGTPRTAAMVPAAAPAAECVSSELRHSRVGDDFQAVIPKQLGVSERARTVKERCTHVPHACVPATARAACEYAIELGALGPNAWSKLSAAICRCSMAHVGEVVSLLRSRGLTIDAKGVVAAHGRMLRRSQSLGGIKQLLLWAHHARRARRTNCVYCRSPMRNGAWCVTCDLVACSQCVRKQMGDSFAAVAEAHFAHWRCHECAAVALGDPRPVRSWRALYEGQRARGRWACLKCTFLSSPTVSLCGACGWEPTISRPLVGHLPDSGGTISPRSGSSDSSSGGGGVEGVFVFAVQAANPDGRTLPLPQRASAPTVGSAALPWWPGVCEGGQLVLGRSRGSVSTTVVAQSIGALSARDVMARTLVRVQGQAQDGPGSDKLQGIITALAQAAESDDHAGMDGASQRNLINQWTALLSENPSLASAVGAAQRDVSSLVAHAAMGHASLVHLARGAGECARHAGPDRGNGRSAAAAASAAASATAAPAAKKAVRVDVLVRGEGEVQWSAAN